MPSKGSKYPSDRHPPRWRHGRTRSKEWNAWVSMRVRCYNQGAINFARYGGRGIMVCDRWRNSFEDFLADVGETPSSKHTLERKDNSGPYEPGNVGWAIPSQQARNRRSSVCLEHEGRWQTMAAWAEEYGMRTGTLWERLRLGWSVQRALTTPVRQYRKR